MPSAIDRRRLIGGTAALAVTAAAGAFAAPTPPPALARVILDNDFAGDPDGLFQLAHHVLCPAVRIPLIIGSHLPPRFEGPQSATKEAAKAAELLRLMGRDGEHRPVAGSEVPIASRTRWRPVAATAAIVREAMRTDTAEPLVYAAGAGLTDLALAWLAEPRIGRRLKLVWIGGEDHPGFTNPMPGPPEMEFNLSLDPIAAQIIFNESDIEIWQVPSGTYRQMLFSNAEMDELASDSPLGAYLQREVEQIAARLAAIPGIPPIAGTEAYVLGDSPLVTLTALVPPFHPDPASSPYRLLPTPRLNAAGTYSPRPNGRPMRVYTGLDAGLTFRDMTARFRAFARKAR